MEKIGSFYQSPAQDSIGKYQRLARESLSSPRRTPEPTESGRIQLDQKATGNLKPNPLNMKEYGHTHQATSPENR